MDSEDVPLPARRRQTHKFAKYICYLKQVHLTMETLSPT
jgi:hypothetical protein